MKYSQIHTQLLAKKNNANILCEEGGGARPLPPRPYHTGPASLPLCTGPASPPPYRLFY